jgi:hypothetical protein
MRHPATVGHTRSTGTGATRSRRSGRRRARRIARAIMVAALEVSVAIALLLMLRGGPQPLAAEPEPLNARAVAVEPASFRSQDLRVQGTIVDRPTRIKHRDAGTFVLEGAGAKRLLVVPAGDARLTAFRAGTKVIVDGSVVIPPDNPALARRTTSRTAIAKRANAPALIKATRVMLAP